MASVQGALTFAQALAVAQEEAYLDDDKRYRAAGLRALIPDLPPDLANGALAALGTSRVELALIAQQSRLDAAEKERLVRDAYFEVRERNPGAVTDGLVALAPHLPVPLADELRTLASQVVAKAVEAADWSSEWTLCSVDLPPQELLSALERASDRILLAGLLAEAAPSNAQSIAVALRNTLPADEHWRIPALRHFSRIAPEVLYSPWKSTSTALAASTRAEA
jgi:hypothetical protein